MVTTYKPVDRSASAAEIAASPTNIRRNGTGWYVRSQSSATTWYWCNTERCTCPDWAKRQPVGGCKHMRSVQMHLEEERRASLPTCEHCKHQGEDVTTVSVYVGGHGHVEHVYCRNQVECWKRWDKAHGYAS